MTDSFFYGPLFWVDTLATNLLPGLRDRASHHASAVDAGDTSRYFTKLMLTMLRAYVGSLASIRPTRTVHRQEAS